MKKTAGLLVCVLVALMMTAAGCQDTGVGMGVPPSGARWGGPGPDVMMGGGPVR